MLQHGGEMWTESMQRSSAYIRGQREELPDGSIKVASIKDRQRFYKTHQSSFPYIAKAAHLLVDMHASTGPAERNWSAWKRLYGNPLRNRLAAGKAEKLVFIKANSDIKEAEDKEVCLTY